MGTQLRHPTHALPSPLCGHEAPLVETGHRVACSQCHSYWDKEYIRRPFQYDPAYAEDRAHYNDSVGALKVRTFEKWIEKANIRVAGRSVCEVGFGGGHCLRHLAERASCVYGVEISERHLQHAESLGLSRDGLFLFSNLPERLEPPVDLWIFQDSFEHLCDPTGFLRWMTAQSHHGSEVLIVLPEAGSFSERVFGRFWPHRIPDHSFHWSESGLRDLFERNGYRLMRRFFPWKYLSLHTIVAHFAHKLGVRAELNWASARWPIRFNLGEMGLLLRRNDS